VKLDFIINLFSLSFVIFILHFQLNDVIDLVIPRGSNKIVSQNKSSTKIPVLGHDGKTLMLMFKYSLS